MKQLTNRQASILIFLSIVALKVIVLPSIIYFHAGSSGYVTIFFALIVDFTTLLLYLHIMKKNPDMNAAPTKSILKINVCCFFKNWAEHSGYITK